RSTASDQQTLLPSYFHPDLQERCATSFASGDYFTAILNAFRYIKVRVRDLAQLSSTDVSVGVVNNAMGQKSTRIFFSKVITEQEGYQALFRGAVATLKNPLSHKEVEHLD
ncbi:TIGR02391 family protein, partial [Deinococcus sp. HMF7604]|uniref:TIGR02391 family protein n=1 Tax=Deinococcus betulae TaxID=2873312 RepID=UPI001CCA3BA9